MSRVCTETPPLVAYSEAAAAPTLPSSIDWEAGVHHFSHTSGGLAQGAPSWGVHPGPTLPLHQYPGYGQAPVTLRPTQRLAIPLRNQADKHLHPSRGSLDEQRPSGSPSPQQLSRQQHAQQQHRVPSQHADPDSFTGSQMSAYGSAAYGSAVYGSSAYGSAAHGTTLAYGNAVAGLQSSYGSISADGFSSYLQSAAPPVARGPGGGVPSPHARPALHRPSYDAFSIGSAQHGLYPHLQPRAFVAGSPAPAAAHVTLVGGHADPRCSVFDSALHPFVLASLPRCSSSGTVPPLGLSLSELPAPASWMVCDDALPKDSSWPVHFSEGALPCVPAMPAPLRHKRISSRGDGFEAEMRRAATAAHESCEALATCADARRGACAVAAADGAAGGGGGERKRAKQADGAAHPRGVVASVSDVAALQRASVASLDALTLASSLSLC